MGKKFSQVSAAHLTSMNYSINGSNASLVHSVIRNSDRTYGEVELAALIPNPFQPRKRYNEEKLRELAASIEENGLIEPIVVRRTSSDQKLEIVCGERRVRATRDILRWESIHAEIINCTDGELRRIAVLENVQREDLSPLEVGSGYQALLGEKDQNGNPIYTIRSLGEKLGKNKDHIQEHVSLLTLPEEIKSLLEQDNPIPRRVALELANIEDVERSYLIQEYQEGELKPQQLLEIIRAYKIQQRENALLIEEVPDQQRENALLIEEVPDQQRENALLIEEPTTLQSNQQSRSTQPNLTSDQEGFSVQEKSIDQAENPALHQSKTKNLRKSSLSLLTLQKKLTEQNKQIQKIVEKYKKDFPNMSPDEQKLVTDFATQCQHSFHSLLESH